MTQQARQQRDSTADREQLHPEFPHDAERFAGGLEADRKLRKAWLIAGLLSQAALAGMFVTALGKPGRAWPAVLAILAVGLGLGLAEMVLGGLGHRAGIGEALYG